MFLDFQKITVFEGFLVFLTKERPILTVIKQMMLDEIKQWNGIKPQKINFFMIVCKFLPHKGNFCWKVPSKVNIPFTCNIKNIPSAHQSSTLYLKLSLSRNYEDLRDIQGAWLPAGTKLQMGERGHCRLSITTSFLWLTRCIVEQGQEKWDPLFLG